jgi:hypothetical protein
MTLKESVAFFFLAGVLYHDPIIGLTNQAVLAHLVLGLGILSYVLVLTISASKALLIPWKGGLLAMFSILPFAMIGFFYAMLSSNDLNLKIQFASVFVIIPMAWSCIDLSQKSPSLKKAIVWLVYWYIILEFLLALAQLSYFLLGIGLKANTIHEGMVAGSQFNGNNLAAIIVLLAIFLLYHKEYFTRLTWIFIQVVIVLTLVFTFSRLALIIYVFSFIVYNGFPKPKQLLLYTLFIFLFFYLVMNVDSVGFPTIDNLIYKARSILMIFTVGFETDSSTMGRSESYYNFFNQLPHLGWGSGEILNYTQFTKGVNFSDPTLYFNPHSLIIELGYWMGYLGVILFIILLGFLYFCSLKHSLVTRIWIIIIVLLVSSIPSSAIPLMAIWIGMMLLASIDNRQAKVSYSNG